MPRKVFTLLTPMFLDLDGSGIFIKVESKFHRLLRT